MGPSDSFRSETPVIGFAAFSGTGKTTLLRELIPCLRRAGLRIGVIKHAHHRFDVDYPGKDSYELRKAGAAHMLIASANRRALIVDNEAPTEPDFAQLLASLDHSQLDLVLVEGFKRQRFAKVELYRPSLGHPLLQPDDDSVVAIATDAPLGREVPVPLLDLNDAPAVADFVLRQTGLAR